MEFSAIRQAIEQKFGPEVIEAADPSAHQPWLQLRLDALLPVGRYLRDEETLLFDFLHNLSGVDYGEKVNQLGVVYHLSSLIHEHQLVLKVRLDRAAPPPVTSLSALWRAADWHEREAYDLLGIPFADHPDLRRILMPADWDGHPLRKDYQSAERYHDVPIAYEDAERADRPEAPDEEGTAPS